MAAHSHPPIYTFEEYLALERSSDERHEFHDGLIVSMAGGTEPHARLCARMISLLDRLFPECRVYGENLSVRIETWNRGVYPDAMLLRGELVFWKEDRDDVITNPQLVVEVLSPSIAKFDRGQKRELYKSLPSVTDILLVSQDSPFVEHTRREGDGWSTRQHTGDASFEALGQLVPIPQLYRGIF